jgi:hypothetical protein
VSALHNRALLQPRLGHSSMIALSTHPRQHQGRPSNGPRSRTPIRYAAREASLVIL